MKVDGRVSAAQVGTLLGSWQEGVRGPGYLALATRLRLAVTEGRLPLGVRLPAERDLATHLHVSRGFVTAAFEELRRQGYLASRRGAGSWTTSPVGGGLDGPAIPLAPHPSLGSSVVDLGLAAPVADGAVIRDAVARATEALGAHLGGHGYDLLGLPLLRDALARRFTERGLPTDGDQIVVTNGAQHAIMLAMRVLLGAGDRVLVEHPTYPHGLEAIRREGGRPVPAPFDGGRWDLTLMASMLREATPRAAYLMPDVHNPTGCVLPDDARRELVEMLRRHGTAAVVDEALVDLRFDDERRPRPFAAARTGDDAPVLTVGTLSKTHWGGLRVGWLRGPREFIRRVAAVRASIDVSTPVLGQLVAVELLAAPDVVQRHRAEARHRRDHLHGLLTRHLPDWRFDVPAGGLSFWVDLGAPVSSALAAAAAATGVRIVSGAQFGVGSTFESHLRVPYVVDEDDLGVAVRGLARAWESIDTRRTTSALPPPMV